VPPGALPAPTANAPHTSSTILYKTSRSATDNEDSEKFTNYQRFFSYSDASAPSPKFAAREWLAKKLTSDYLT
jgi:hypothetical protein